MDRGDKGGMMDELLPCPLCGDEPDVYQTSDGKWHICCLNMKSNQDCLLSMIDHDFEFNSVIDMGKAWNTRIGENDEKIK